MQNKQKNKEHNQKKKRNKNLHPQLPHQESEEQEMVDVKLQQFSSSRGQQ